MIGEDITINTPKLTLYLYNSISKYQYNSSDFKELLIKSGVARQFIGNTT